MKSLLKVSTFEEMENLIDERYDNFRQKYCQLGKEISLYKNSFVSLKRTLSEKDLKGLSEIHVKTDHGWLWSDIVNAYLYIISQRYPYFGFNLHTFWNSYVEQSKPPENYRKTTMKQLDVVIGKSHYAVPILRRNHWTVAIVRLDLRQYSLLDSMPNRRGTTTTSYNRLQYLTQLIQRKLDRPYETMWYNPMDSEKQTDNYNCGVYVCWYVKRFVSNENLRDSTFNPNKFRIEIFNTIIEYCSANSLYFHHPRVFSHCKIK